MTTTLREPLLDVDGLQIELITANGIIRPVDGIHLSIAAGETVTVIGESGSGKSTTAMGILRLLPDDLAILSGSVRMCGVDVVRDPRGARRLRGSEVSLVPQEPMTALSPVHTIGRQLVEAVRLGQPDSSRGAARAAAVDLLDQVRVPQPERQLGRYPHQLSGGMLQRVLIAIALAGRPRLLIADEPTSALDVTVQAGILDILMELQERENLGILMITHDLGVARLVSDRIHVMKNGRFVESAAAEALTTHPEHDYTQKLLAAVPVLGAWQDPAGDHPRRDAEVTG